MKRILALVLCLAMAAACFAGCGGGDGEGGPASGGSPAVQTPAPTPTPEPYDPQPLTGSAKPEGYTPSRPVAVMVNNIAQCRPQRGLNDAGVVYEIKVEGGITRFMALYDNYQAMGQVGPVRSARDQFFRLVRPFQALYVHIGRSGITQEYMDVEEYGALDANGDYDTIAIWDAARQARGYSQEHTAYTSGELLGAYVEKYGLDMGRGLTSPVFDFVDYREPARALGGQDALSVGIVHSNSYRTYFDYDVVSNRYLMSQYNWLTGMVEETADELTGERTGFENLVILFTEITKYPYPGGNIDPVTGQDKGDPDYQKVEYDFGGVGFYINGGRAEPIRWVKGGTPYALLLQDENGESLKVNVGRSYVAVVSLDEYENFRITGAETSAADESVSVDPDAAEREAAAVAAAE